LIFFAGHIDTYCITLASVVSEIRFLTTIVFMLTHTLFLSLLWEMSFFMLGILSIFLPMNIT
jgi:hypothetical protein